MSSSLASRIPSPGAPAARYGGVAITLHWLLAALLLGMLGMGWYMTGLPFSPQRLKLYNWHKWAGVAVLALAALRLAWRLAKRPPPLPARVAAAMPRWQRAAHHGVQGLLIALSLLVPLLGWAYSSAAGFPVVFLGLVPLPDLLAADEALADLVKPWHARLAYMLAALALVHILAALKHHWLDRDGLLARMWPGGARG